MIQVSDDAIYTFFKMQSKLTARSNGVSDADLL